MKCDFCGRSVERGSEYIFVDSAGRAVHFCSSKCEKNLLKLGRKPQHVKWTQAYRREKEIRIKAGGHEKQPAKPEHEEKKAEKPAAKKEPEKQADKEHKKPRKEAKQKAEKAATKK